MSAPAELNKEYDVKQGKNVVILNDGTVTMETRFVDSANWFTLIDAGTDTNYAVEFLKEAKFRFSTISSNVEFDFATRI